MSIAKRKTEARVHLFIKGFKGGVAAAWLHDPNKNIGVKMRFAMLNLAFNEDWIRDHLEIHMICDRRGSNGDTPLSTSGEDSTAEFPIDDGWTMIPMVLGEHNTPEGRMEAAMLLVTYFNVHEGTRTGNQPTNLRRSVRLNGNPITSPIRNVRFGGNLSSSPMSAMDTEFLDGYVLSYMSVLNPDLDIIDHIEDPEFMSIYWTDIEHGARYMNACHQER